MPRKGPTPPFDPMEDLPLVDGFSDVSADEFAMSDEADGAPEGTYLGLPRSPDGSDSEPPPPPSARRARIIGGRVSSWEVELPLEVIPATQDWIAQKQQWVEDHPTDPDTAEWEKIIALPPEEQVYEYLLDLIARDQDADGERLPDEQQYDASRRMAGTFHTLMTQAILRRQKAVIQAQRAQMVELIASAFPDQAAAIRAQFGGGM